MLNKSIIIEAAHILIIFFIVFGVCEFHVIFYSFNIFLSLYYLNYNLSDCILSLMLFDAAGEFITILHAI